jgi:hypothetical protein
MRQPRSKAEHICALLFRISPTNANVKANPKQQANPKQIPIPALCRRRGSTVRPGIDGNRWESICRPSPLSSLAPTSRSPIRPGKRCRGYPYRRGETGSDRLRQAEWKPSPKTDQDSECEFHYESEGWTKPYRFIALRTAKPREEVEDEEAEQYQLFETSRYKYRVLVTDFVEPIDFVVWFYGRRGGAEDLIKEANKDAGLAAHPSGAST